VIEDQQVLLKDLKNEMRNQNAQFQNQSNLLQRLTDAASFLPSTTTNQPFWLKTYTIHDPQTFWIMVQAIGILTTLLLIFRQIQLQRLGNSIISLAEIERIWKERDMINARKIICKNFQDNKELEACAAERIASFFEKLGLYHERKIFDSKIIWELYSHYVENYWGILKKEITLMRINIDDQTIYTHFEKFFNDMAKISKRRNAPDSRKTKEQLLEFSEQEQQET
jgi:hypothetical protein